MNVTIENLDWAEAVKAKFGEHAAEKFAFFNVPTDVKPAEYLSNNEILFVNDDTLDMVYTLGMNKGEIKGMVAGAASVVIGIGIGYLYYRLLKKNRER